MTRILGIIALLFATPVWAKPATSSQFDPAAYAAQANEGIQKMDEVNDKINFIGAVFLMILTVIMIAVVSINYLPKKLIISLFGLLALVGLKIYNVNGFDGLVLLAGVLSIAVMSGLTFHDIRNKTGENHFHGGDFGSGD